MGHAPGGEPGRDTVNDTPRGSGGGNDKVEVGNSRDLITPVVDLGADE